MSIYKGSRYEYSTVDYIQTKLRGSENPIVFYYLSSFSNISYYEHQYVSGERLDQIAYKYYKNSGYWWAIIEFNPQITDFTNIPEGSILKVPRV